MHGAELSLQQAMLLSAWDSCLQAHGYLWNHVCDALTFCTCTAGAACPLQKPSLGMVTEAYDLFHCRLTRLP